MEPVYEAESHGGLPYIVCWVSLDGRPCVEPFETLAAMVTHAKYLTQLGRQPSMWHRVVGAK